MIGQLNIILCISVNLIFSTLYSSAEVANRDLTYKTDRYVSDVGKVGFDVESFNNELQNLIRSDEYAVLEHKLLRLQKLQEYVWQGALTLFTFERGLKSLEGFMPRHELSAIRHQLVTEVKRFQLFIEQNFQSDLLQFLNEVTNKNSMIGLEELLSFYEPLLNHFDYARAVACFGEYARSHFQMTEAQAKAVNVIVKQKLHSQDHDEIEQLEAERKSFLLGASELPFYCQDVPKQFNSSLTSQNKAPQKEQVTLMSCIAGIAYALYKGASFVLHHPGKVLTIGLAAQAMPVVAQFLGGEFIINQDVVGWSDRPVAAMLADGSIFVAWSQSTSNDIYGRLLGSNGTALGNEFKINQNLTTAFVKTPSIAGLTNGNIFVAWAGNLQEVFGTVLTSNGSALINEFKINQNATNRLNTPSVASLIDGNVMVTWAEPAGIYGRLFFPNGSALADSFRISQDTVSQLVYNPFVASVDNERLVVIWLSDLQLLSLTDLVGRFLFLNGTGNSTEFLIDQTHITDTRKSEVTPLIAPLENGNLIATFAYESGLTFVFVGRLLLPDGSPFGNTISFSDYRTNLQKPPAAVGLDNKNAFVVWANYDIFARILNGSATDTTFTVSENSVPVLNYCPTVIKLANGNLFITWGGSAIRGRILLPPYMPSPDSSSSSSPSNDTSLSAITVSQNASPSVTSVSSASSIWSAVSSSTALSSQATSSQATAAPVSSQNNSVTAISSGPSNSNGTESADSAGSMLKALNLY